jgi:WD40 repeat protein
MRSFLCGIALLSLVALPLHQTPPELQTAPADNSANQTEAPTTDRFGDPLPPGALARLGTIRLRSTPSELFVSADGKTLFTASRPGIICRLDAETGRLLSEVHLQGAGLHYPTFSADGKALAVPENDKVGLFDVSTGKRIGTLPGYARSLALSPDGTVVATSPQRQNGNEMCRIVLWDVATAKDRLLAEFRDEVGIMAFAPDGKRLFIAADKSLSCWDVATAKQVWRSGHDAYYLAVSSDGKTLCTTESNGQLVLWNAQTGKRAAELDTDLKSPAYSRGTPVFSPNGELIAQRVDLQRRIWDVASRKLTKLLDDEPGTVAFAPDSKSLYTLGNVLLRWDIATGKLLYADTRGHGHVGAVMALAFAPDGRTLATSGRDETIRVWKIGEAIHHVLQSKTIVNRTRNWSQSSGGGVMPMPLAITADSRYLLSDDGMEGVLRVSVKNPDGSVLEPGPLELSLTDIASGKQKRLFQLPKEASFVVATRLTVDGRFLWALGESLERIGKPPKQGQPLRCWDVATGKEVLTITIPGRSLFGAEFSPDGKLLALPKPARLQAVRNGGQRVLADEHVGVPFVFSPDARLLATSESKGPYGRTTAVRLFEVLTGKLLARMELSTSSSLQEMAFSPDGRLVGAISAGAVLVWETSTGNRVFDLLAKIFADQKFDGDPTCLHFAPDGKSLATGHAKGTVLLWDLTGAWLNITPPPGPVDAAACWDALAEPDPPKAYAAIAKLAAAPAKAMPLFSQKLAPVKVDPKAVAAWLVDLNSEKFAVREAAVHNLTRLADAVESELRQALENPQSLESRNRILGILKTYEANQIAVPPSEMLQQLRAITVLERIGSEQALSFLRHLETGAPDARLTQEAHAAILRLSR